jgi:hypothetical protein
MDALNKAEEEVRQRMADALHSEKVKHFNQSSPFISVQSKTSSSLIIPSDLFPPHYIVQHTQYLGSTLFTSS